MLESLNRKYTFNDDLKSNLKAFIGVSLGIFLFILYFKPFTLDNPDFDNKLLIISGFGAITLLLLFIIRVVIPSFSPASFGEHRWNYVKELAVNLIFLVCNSVASIFYAQYVGNVSITFHTAVIIVIISISAMTVIIVFNEFKRMKSLLLQFKALKNLEEEADELVEEDEEIEFASENKSEYFKILLEQIMLIKSARNYIEVIYKNADKVSHRLIRNSIKNTEELLSKYSNLVRCHRSCIVNKNYIRKIVKGSDGLKLTLFDYQPEIHVSRQYAIKLKEAMKQGE